MEVLWQTDSALTVRQVSNGLPQSLAHTTVMTVLDRLAKKGFARRERDGRAWRYRPAATREAYVAELMLTALAQTGDRDAALARFAQSVSGAEAEVLREALSGLEREHRRSETRRRQRGRIMGALADAVLLAAVAVGSVRCARAMLRASWPRRSPAAAILLWQALGLAGGLAAVGALLAIGVSGQGTHAGVLGGLTALARRLASGQLIAPHQPLVAHRHQAHRARRRVRPVHRALRGAGDGVRRRGRRTAPAAGAARPARARRPQGPRRAGDRLPGGRRLLPAGHPLADRGERRHARPARPGRARPPCSPTSAPTCAPGTIWC